MVNQGSMNLEQACQLANQVLSSKFPAASVAFLGGSVSRNEATSTSDLDIVVIYSSIPQARREAFAFEGVRVDTFVHDLETLQYFVEEVDVPSGCPGLPSMIADGIPLPEASKLSEKIKTMMKGVLSKGPPPLTEKALTHQRFLITDLIADIADPRNPEEFLATATRLYSSFGDLWLRSQNAWSGQGKSLFRQIKAVDPEFAKKFHHAFSTAFSSGDASLAIKFCEEALKPVGGALLDLTEEAPPNWKRKSQI